MSKLKLNQRLLVWFILLSLGPIGIVAYHGYFVASHSLTEATEADLRRIARHRVDLLRAWITERKGDVDFIAETARRPCPCGCLEDDKVTVARACDYIESGLGDMEQFERIELYDRDWKLQRSSSERSAHLEFWDTTTIRSHFPEDPRPTSRVHHAHDGIVCVCLGTELRDSSGTPIGYLLAAAKLSDSFEAILWSREADRGGRSLLVAEDGVLLASSTGADTLGVPQTAHRVFVGESGNASYRGWDGTPILAGFHRIPELGAIFIVERDRNVAFGWLSSLAWQISLVALLCLLAVSLVSRHVSRGLTRPLHRLLAETQRIGSSGSLDERVPPLEGIELQDLGAAFNRMLDQLELSNRKLVESVSLAAAGELSTSIVHELRNPLSSVCMNLQALRQKVEDDEVHRELADIASDQVRRIDRMLGDLMDFAKPLPMDSRATALEEVIRASIEAVSADLKERGVQVNVQNELPGEVLHVDPDRLCQTLTNLLQNAVQASHEGGQVDVRVRASPASEARLQIVIRDRGPGLAEDNMDRLFKPFFTTKENGSGLGLANARKLLRLQGGTIRAQNHEEGGAVFALTLPRSGVPAT